MVTGPTLSIVIPCHNEAKAIRNVLSDLERSLDSLQRDSLIGNTQVIVVDDASSDDTREILASYSWVRTVSTKKQSGYGAALKFGFEQCVGDWIAFFDMDDTYDPIDLERLVRSALSGDAKMITGDRLQTGHQMSWLRNFGNEFYSLLVRKLWSIPMKDACTGYRVFHRSLTPAICRLPEDGLNFSLSMTLWSVREAISTVEVPISYRVRTGTSKLSVLMDGWLFLWVILKNAFQYRRSHTQVSSARQ